MKDITYLPAEEQNDVIGEESVLYSNKEECEIECRKHEYYKLICDFEKQRAKDEIERCQQRVLELEKYLLSGDFEDMNPTDLPPPCLPYREFNFMKIIESEYEELMQGRRFIISTDTGFSHYSTWYLFKMPNGILYFVCKRFSFDRDSYNVRQIGYNLTESNVYFIQSSK